MGIFIAGLDSFFPGKCHPPQHRCALTPHSFAPSFKVKIWMKGWMKGSKKRRWGSIEKKKTWELKNTMRLVVNISDDEIGGQY